MKAFNIPNILESLKHSVEHGEISIEEAAEELCEANLIPYIDVNKTKEKLKIK